MTTPESDGLCERSTYCAFRIEVMKTEPYHPVQFRKAMRSGMFAEFNMNSSAGDMCGRVAPSITYMGGCTLTSVRLKVVSAAGSRSQLTLTLVSRMVMLIRHTEYRLSCAPAAKLCRSMNPRSGQPGISAVSKVKQLTRVSPLSVTFGKIVTPHMSRRFVTFQHDMGRSWT
jgi:hypothetical protein